MRKFTHTTKNLPKHTREIKVEVPWDLVVTKREEVFDRLAQDVKAPGFRQGKAPREIAARYIDPQKVYEIVVRDLLPQIYQDLIETEKLQPVTQPAVELTSAKDSEPWQITFTVAETPEVVLGDYLRYIAQVHKDHREKQTKEATMNDQKTGSKKSGSKSKSSKNTHTHPHTTESSHDDPHGESTPIQDIFNSLLTNSTCEIPDLLLHQEVDRRLSRLVDDVRKVGLTLDKYLASRDLTLDALKSQYMKDSEEMYRLEFVLAKVAEEQKIEVSQQELDAILATAKTPQEKEIANTNLAWYEALLRKQKAIDFLNSL